MWGHGGTSIYAYIYIYEKQPGVPQDQIEVKYSIIIYRKLFKGFRSNSTSILANYKGAFELQVDLSLEFEWRRHQSGRDSSRTTRVLLGDKVASGTVCLRGSFPFSYYYSHLQCFNPTIHDLRILFQWPVTC